MRNQPEDLHYSSPSLHERMDRCLTLRTQNGCAVKHIKFVPDESNSAKPSLTPGRATTRCSARNFLITFPSSATDAMDSVPAPVYPSGALTDSRLEAQQRGLFKECLLPWLKSRTSGAPAEGTAQGAAALVCVRIGPSWGCKASTSYKPARDTPSKSAAWGRVSQSGMLCVQHVGLYFRCGC